MKIGIIGSGQMGSTLASKFVEQGHEVSIANSRGLASLQPLAASIGVKAVTVESIAKNKDVIVVSIHEKFVTDLPQHLFKDLPANVVVIDTGNYYPSLRGGYIPELDESGTDSAWVQQQLGVPVVKVFNSVFATTLRDAGRPQGDKNRIALTVAGDDSKDKEIIFALANEMGFDAFDTGTIAQSWKQQPGSPIYCRDITLAEMKQRFEIMEKTPGLRELIIAKRKSDEKLMATDYPAYLESLKEKFEPGNYQV